MTSGGVTYGRGGVWWWRCLCGGGGYSGRDGGFCVFLFFCVVSGEMGVMRYVAFVWVLRREL